MEKKHKGYKIHNRPAITVPIKNMGLTDLNGEFLEVTPWINGEGVDIYFSKGCVDKLPIRLALSFEETDALRGILKAINTLPLP
jgi:hypothetical protein